MLFFKMLIYDGKAKSVKQKVSSYFTIALLYSILSRVGGYSGAIAMSVQLVEDNCAVRTWSKMLCKVLKSDSSCKVHC